LGWGVARGRPGILYENHGTIGATVALLGRMNPATLAAELADSDPVLIIVAFGTNEGFDDALDLAGYAARFRDHVAVLQAMAPAAAILVLGPPDGNRLPPSCPRSEARQDVCTAGETAAPSSCAWHEPPNLAAVRESQRRVAAAQGWAFWDWSQVMGGPCSMHRLFLRDPPLAFADHVHLNGAGYAATADVLFFDLMNAYEDWKRGAKLASK
ncbi:MAG TPA: GDSL-type esterase/lipase family protein, partial [Stellaceae bacterium]|nr:GDSL-type esterase/lipase family protein [Stellaceae bacterium]